MKPVPYSEIPNNWLFTSLPLDLRWRVQKACAFIEVEQGEVIAEKGSTPDHCFFVLQGLVHVVDRNETGKEMLLSEIAPGKVFGALSVIQGTIRPHMSVMAQPGLIGMLSADCFNKLRQSDLGFANACNDFLAQTVRRFGDMLVDFGLMETRARIISDLLRNARVQPDGRLMIMPRPRHADIGSRVNATRETVCRELNRLCDKGWLAKRDDGLEICDAMALRGLIGKPR